MYRVKKFQKYLGFHARQCGNIYGSSSNGAIRLNPIRRRAIACDRHQNCCRKLESRMACRPRCSAMKSIIMKNSRRRIRRPSGSPTRGAQKELSSSLKNRQGAGVGSTGLSSRRLPRESGSPLYCGLTFLRWKYRR